MFFIRADGNAKIGAGHLMRCLTIAEELSALTDSEAICFVCADCDSAALARENGFRAHVLGTDYRDMETELPGLRELTEKPGSSEEAAGNVFLVDSYFVTDRYLAELREWGKVVLMDDMGRCSYPVDCLINYNAPADPACYARLYKGRDTRLLIGSSYTPVRQQFRNVKYQVAGQVRDVLITTGGGDIENIAGDILKHIWEGRINFHLVTGRFNPHLGELEKLAGYRKGITIYHDVKNMAGLMGKCDMAVTAGGSTVYELMTLGVPFVCFSCAENQEALVDYVGRTGLGAAAGAWHKNSGETIRRIAELFQSLKNDRNKREEFSLRGQAVVDGKGALRLAKALTEVGS